MQLWEFPPLFLVSAESCVCSDAAQPKTGLSRWPSDSTSSQRPSVCHPNPLCAALVNAPQWACGVTAKIFPLTLLVFQTMSPDNSSQGPTGVCECVWVCARMCVGSWATHTLVFTCVAARMCLSKHSPPSGSEVGPDGSSKSRELSNPEWASLCPLCKRGFVPTNWPVCWKMMRMEGVEEPGGEPTCWHENGGRCQLANV